MNELAMLRDVAEEMNYEIIKLNKQLKIAKSYLYLIANQMYVGEKDNCVNDAQHALDIISEIK